MIENTCGTAPGIAAKIRGARGVCRAYVVPGVPKEMKAMFTRDILPKLREAGGGVAAIVSRTLHTFGVGESTIGERLGELMARGRNPSVGTTVAVAARVEAVRARSLGHHRGDRLHPVPGDNQDYPQRGTRPGLHRHGDAVERRTAAVHRHLAVRSGTADGDSEGSPGPTNGIPSFE